MSEDFFSVEVSVRFFVTGEI